MAQFELDIQLLGDEEVQAKLREVGSRALLAEPALRHILTIFRESEAKTFSSNRWTPNAPATLKHKRGSRPLVDSGALRRSFTDEGSSQQVAEVGDDYAKFGSKLWYAHFSLGTKTEPKRSPVNLRVSERVRIRNVIRNWVLHGTVSEL